MSKITIGNYLLKRLLELGIYDVFGVPGDYNLIFLDEIVNFKGIEWVGNCNELNAAYAADGYARIKGAAALVTTFGVGELSAINGVAGSYAEYLPVVNIVGAPSTTLQKARAIMHHTFGAGDFSVFIHMYEKLSAAVAVLDCPETAAKRIDDALEICWVKKQPVYISLPSDMVNVEISKPKKPLHLAYPDSDKDAVNELVARTVALIRHARSPVILADICASRHNMKALLHKLLDETGMPFATMNMGKGIINESHRNYIGIYNGDYSSLGVQKRVESSDCIIAFGSLMSDFNTGGFTSNIDANALVEIHSDHVKVRHSMYHGVYFNAVIPALIKALSGYKHHETTTCPLLDVYKPTDDKITQKRFWNSMAHYFKRSDIIVAETGTSMFGLLETRVPDDATVIAQSLWGSIGYSVGAMMGAALAAPKRRTILFVGDGSFQLSAQEISTAIKHHLTPIIFLLNNNGYTIERVIHGAKMMYNDIQPWDYAKLPAIFGSAVYSVKVNTEHDLAAALLEVRHHQDKLCFIEVKMDWDDCPENLRLLGKACDVKNSK